MPFRLCTRRVKQNLTKSRRAPKGASVRYLFEGSLQAAAACHEGEQRHLQVTAPHAARPSVSRVSLPDGF